MQTRLHHSSDSSSKSSSRGVADKSAFRWATALEISENGVKTGDLSCNNLTVDGKADIKKTGALVIESPASTVSNKHLVLSNITQSTLGTDGLGASIDFDQTYMYDLSTPVHGVDSGRIEVLCEQDWTTPSSTRDSDMKF